MRHIQSDIIGTVSHIHPTPRMALDVGCSDGYFTRILAAALPSTMISAIDPKIEKLPKDSGNITYRQSEIETLPFASNSFDLVVACMSFHHWSDKQKGIHEAFRVLAPKGVLVIGDPFFEGVMQNRFMAWFLQVTDGGRFTSFSDFESYVHAAGFDPLATQPVSNSWGTMFVVSVQKPDASGEIPHVVI